MGYVKAIEALFSLLNFANNILTLLSYQPANILSYFIHNFMKNVSHWRSKNQRTAVGFLFEEIKIILNFSSNKMSISFKANV